MQFNLFLQSLCFLFTQTKTKNTSKKFAESTILVFGFGGIADTEYSVSVETNYSAEYSAETDIRSTTNIYSTY
jgi:hypothetical protein